MSAALAWRACAICAARLTPPAGGGACANAAAIVTVSSIAPLNAAITFLGLLSMWILGKRVWDEICLVSRSRKCFVRRFLLRHRHLRGAELVGQLVDRAGEAKRQL